MVSLPKTAQLQCGRCKGDFTAAMLPNTERIRCPACNKDVESATVQVIKKLLFEIKEGNISRAQMGRLLARARDKASRENAG